MAMKKITGSGTVRFEIRIRDDAPDDVFTRGQDDDWGKYVYGPMSKDEIIRHWLWNAAALGVDDMSRIDGWADCPSGSIMVDIDDVDLDGYRDHQ